MTASELGYAAEHEILAELLALGLEVRHATEAEDWNEHFDLAIYLGGYEIRVDVTISKAEFQQKMRNHPAGVIPALVDCRWSARQKAMEVMRQVVHNLRGPIVRDLLAVMGGR